MKQHLLLLVAFVVTVGCGHSPTAPAPVPTPTPPPVVEAPAPPPPVEVPPPPPAVPPAPPTEDPDADLYFAAETIRTFGPPDVLPGRFEVVIRENAGLLDFAGRGIPLVYYVQHKALIGYAPNAEQFEAHVEDGTWVWTYNSIYGQAHGQMLPKR